MEEGPVETRYWCHMCSQVVNPITGVELKCPFCESGFVEETDSSNAASGGFDESDLASDRALSLWAPILLGIMGNPSRRRGLRRHFLGNVEDYGFDDHVGRERPLEGETDILRSQRGRSATILQLLQSLRAGIVSHSENRSGNGRAGERERVIFINPFHQTIVVQGSPDLHLNQTQNNRSISSLGDYFIGPGLDLLLQHLAENDPNRYGTPPARKEFVESLPTVRIEGSMQCAVCLDDFDHGNEAKEMPCKHKFHNGCLLPWLELHSSCPVCRYQLPVNESQSDHEGSSSNIELGQIGINDDHGRQREETVNGNDRRSLSWPFSSLFSVSGPSNMDPSTMSSSSSSASSTRAPGSASQANGT